MKKTITVGRNEDKCQILLPENNPTRTSREHALIQLDSQDQLWITDISSNGTTLNGQWLTKSKPYPLRWGDEVVFAQEARLDWKAMERQFRRPGGGKETQFGSVAQSFVKSLVDWDSRSSQIALFFRMIPNPSGQLVRFLDTPKSNSVSPTAFFLFGLAAFFFIQHSLGDDQQGIWKLIPQEVPEVVRDALFGVYLLLMGYLNYKFFKWFTGKKISPRHYFHAYICFQAFWQIVLAVTFILLHPMTTQLIGKDAAIGVFGVVYLIANLWLFYHYINLHRRVWNISWWSAFGYQLLVGVIVFAVIMLVAVCIGLLATMLFR